MGDRGQSSCSVECTVSSHGTEQTCSCCRRGNKNGILIHLSQIWSQQMTARHWNKTKCHTEEILNLATNNWLHFSSYWLLSRSCLGKDSESWFMTAHINTESSHSCSEHISILPLKFSHKRLLYSLDQVVQVGMKLHPVSSGTRSEADGNILLVRPCHLKVSYWEHVSVTPLCEAQCGMSRAYSRDTQME